MMKIKATAMQAIVSATALSIMFAGHAAADSHQNIIKTHGWNEFGSLKYDADFSHLDYVNPDAPNGGEISISSIGTFDNMNAFATLTGKPGALATSIYERLVTATSDEVGSSYCLLCESIEYPEDQSWVIYNLRKGVTFSDGTPMTSADVIHTHELFREQGTASYRDGITKLVTKYEALDDHTVKYTFSEDSPVSGAHFANERVDCVAKELV